MHCSMLYDTIGASGWLLSLSGISIMHDLRPLSTSSFATAILVGSLLQLLDMEFKYCSLGANQIRLLRPDGVRIVELEGKVCEVVHYRTQHVSTDEAPPFTAISYDWGLLKPTDCIALDSGLFPVRSNVRSCLTHIHRLSCNSESSEKWRYIWIDAICIDQGNDKEKSAQVRQMDLIYKRADMVCVWLGDLFLANPWLGIDGDPRCYGLNANKSSHIESWEEVLDLVLSRPYWTRFWVVQEFSLARRIEIHAYRMSKPLDGEVFVAMMDAHTRRRTYCLPSAYIRIEELGETLEYVSATELAFERRLQRYERTHKTRRMRLRNLLFRHQMAQCTDKRDRVFSMLGLLSPNYREQLGRFFPDYTLSKWVVAALAIAHMISDNQDVIRGGSIDDDLLRGLLGWDEGESSSKRLLILAWPLVKLFDEPGFRYDAPTAQDIWYHCNRKTDLLGVRLGSDSLWRSPAAKAEFLRYREFLYEKCMVDGEEEEALRASSRMERDLLLLESRVRPYSRIPA